MLQSRLQVLLKLIQVGIAVPAMVVVLVEQSLPAGKHVRANRLHFGCKDAQFTVFCLNDDLRIGVVRPKRNVAPVALAENRVLLAYLSEHFPLRLIRLDRQRPQSSLFLREDFFRNPLRRAVNLCVGSAVQPVPVLRKPNSFVICTV